MIRFVLLVLLIRVQFHGNAHAFALVLSCGSTRKGGYNACVKRKKNTWGTYSKGPVRMVINLVESSSLVVSRDGKITIQSRKIDILFVFRFFVFSQRSSG
jgi:hypothetical protein